jgi:hypothetical protein
MTADELDQIFISQAKATGSNSPPEKKPRIERNKKLPCASSADSKKTMEIDNEDNDEDDDEENDDDDEEKYDEYLMN